MLIAVLDNVRSVYNAASIFRTADGAGFGKIYLCGVTPEPVDEFGRVRPDFAKVSLGAEANVAWARAQDAEQVLDELKGEGYLVLAVEQDRRAVPFYNLSPEFAGREKAVLVLGAEVGGLSEGILGRADKILEIPMLGKKESLNVSVAFGIVAYHIALRFRPGLV